MTNPLTAARPYIQQVPAAAPGLRHEAVFLDRDGVLNENLPNHVKDWGEFQFLPGALDAVARLTRSGARLFIITNQAVINRGLASRATVEEVHARMLSVIAKHGGRIEDLAYCPHRPDEGCVCRKPQPGLLHHLALTHGVDLRRSVVVGDALADVEAGLAAGCEALLVLSGRGRDQHALACAEGRNTRYRVAADLLAATDLLLRAPAVPGGRGLGPRAAQEPALA